MTIITRNCYDPDGFFHTPSNGKCRPLPPDLTFTTKVLEGTYPNYEQVIPESNDEAIAVGRTDFLAALKRVNLIADGACTLEFKGQTLTVKAKGTKTGLCEGSESLLIPRVKPMTVKFNPDFLIEALGAVTDDEVLIQVADKTAPCLFRVASKPWRAVTMCLRPDEDPKAAEAPAVMTIRPGAISRP